MQNIKKLYQKNNTFQCRLNNISISQGCNAKKTKQGSKFAKHFFVFNVVVVNSLTSFYIYINYPKIR